MSNSFELPDNVFSEFDLKKNKNYIQPYVTFNFEYLGLTIYHCDKITKCFILGRFYF